MMRRRPVLPLFALLAASFVVPGLLTARPAAQQDDDSLSKASRQDDNEAKSARATEESSSKDTRVDLSPPSNDEKNHPLSGAAVSDAQEAASDVQELHPWDPHKAAKDVEVGDYYFKRKNYKAAIERYKDALIYKQNDAIATFRLAESLDKTGKPGEAITYYQDYLKILPHGPNAADAQKALARLNPENRASTGAK
jgi:tetratricopeptide (TPR) repeat protein